jgi:preprotein translocase subunit SecD
MTKLRDVLAAADPVRHESAPTEDQRARLRHTIVTAASKSDARARQVHRMRAAALLAFASVAIAAIAGFAILPRGTSTVQAAVHFEVRLAEEQAAPGLTAARAANSNRTVYLHPEVVVTNADIAFSNVIPGNTPSQQFWIDVRLTAAGADKMRQATTNHLGRPVAILIDGEVVAAPTVNSPIGAAAVISCDCTRADAERIAQGMNPNP